MQLASKCHLAISLSFDFRIFFHSIKKVSKPRIFCEIILCIKEDLEYFDKDVVLHSFLQDKKYCIFVFTFICMICKWGGISLEAIFSGANFWRVAFIGGNFMGGNFPDTICVRSD